MTAKEQYIPVILIAVVLALVLGRCRLIEPQDEVNRRYPDSSNSLDTTADTTGSNVPFYIRFRSIQPASLDVVGVGGNEIANICFDVMSALNRPVADNIEIQFQIYGPVDNVHSCSLLTTQDKTTKGTVTARVASATRAGVVEVIASWGQTTVRSTVVPITINGGLPVRTNFIVAAEKRNLAGLDRIGKTLDIRVLAFDRFHNPARVGHAVYFTTNAGGIQAQGLLTADGSCNTVFTSTGNHPTDQIVEVLAVTYDHDNVLIQDTARFMLSGQACIQISPTTFSLAKGARDTLSVLVGDRGGHFLEGGSTVGMSAGAAQILGPSDFVVPDTIGFAVLYTVVIYNPDSSRAGPCVFTVSVSSANGNPTSSIEGKLE